MMLMSELDMVMAEPKLIRQHPETGSTILRELRESA